MNQFKTNIKYERILSFFRYDQYCYLVKQNFSWSKEFYGIFSALKKLKGKSVITFNQNYYLVKKNTLDKLMGVFSLSLDSIDRTIITRVDIDFFSYLKPGKKTRKEQQNPTIQLKHGNNDDIISTRRVKSVKKEWIKNTNAELKEKSTVYEDIFYNKLIASFPTAKQQQAFQIKENIYFADIAINDRKVIIEIDGGYHFTAEQKEKDKKRDEMFNRIGYKVIRLKNEEIDKPLVLEGVIKEIKNIKK